MTATMSLWRVSQEQKSLAEKQLESSSFYGLTQLLDVSHPSLDGVDMLWVIVTQVFFKKKNFPFSVSQFNDKFDRQIIKNQIKKSNRNHENMWRCCAFWVQKKFVINKALMAQGIAHWCLKVECKDHLAIQAPIKVTQVEKFISSSMLLGCVECLQFWMLG